MKKKKIVKDAKEFLKSWNGMKKLRKERGMVRIRMWKRWCRKEQVTFANM